MTAFAIILAIVVVLVLIVQQAHKFPSFDFDSVPDADKRRHPNGAQL